MRRARRPLFALVAGGLVAAALALGPATAAGAGQSESGELPPARLKALTRLFRQELEPYGLELTRGLLQSLETYEVDPDGTHLALYVAPVDADYTSAQYVKNFTKLTREFIPEVFDRWTGLESFDICQEPYADTRETPPPVTQIFVSRTALDRVGSWKKASLSELLAASPRVRNVAAGYYVYFASSLQKVPAYVAAARAAGWTEPTTTGG